MKWNLQSLRWEGNDQVLRNFDAATVSSTCPVLITHFMGSSIGLPVTSLASGACIVGKMMFGLGYCVYHQKRTSQTYSHTLQTMRMTGNTGVGPSMQVSH